MTLKKAEWILKIKIRSDLEGIKDDLIFIAS